MCSRFITTLESRTHLAGDVAFERVGNAIRFTAPAGQDVSFALERVDDQTIRVIGRQETTIGGAESRRIRLGGRQIVFDLRGANFASVNVDGVRHNRAFVVRADRFVGVSFSSAEVGGIHLDQSGQTGSSLEVRNTRVQGGISANLGSGPSNFIVHGSNVAGDMVARFGAGRDLAEVYDTTVAGRVDLDTADGADIVTLAGSRLGETQIRTGAGADRIVLDRTRMGAASVIDDGADTDMIETRLAYDFNRSAHGWRVGFADYAGDQLEDPVARWGDLPEGVAGRGWVVGATNRSDDLIMFLTKTLDRRDGIIAGANYVMSFDVRFASNAPNGSGGIGGPEGEAVWLKLGGSGTPFATSGELNELNADIGDQAESGPAASSSGSIANGLNADELEPGQRPYLTLQRQHTHTFAVQASPHGQLYAFVGTESGYEGRTVVGFRRVEMTLRTSR